MKLIERWTLTNPSEFKMRVDDKHYLDEPIFWKKSQDAEFPYETVQGQNRLVIRLNDFPEEHLYSLLVDNNEVASFDDWPINWSREDDDENGQSGLTKNSPALLSGSTAKTWGMPVPSFELYSDEANESIEQFTATLLQVVDYYSSPATDQSQPTYSSISKWLAPLGKKERFHRTGNRDHIRLLKRGVTAWNQWRLENPFIQPDLSGIDLAGAQLSGINLSRTFLIGANFEKADLTNARFDEANLIAATLKEANLSGALLSSSTLTFTNFDLANLTSAFLSDARCFRASFLGATLVNASLTESSFFETDLSGADLRECRFNYSRWVSSSFRNANLSNCRVHGLTAFNIDLSNALQRNLSISSPGEPSILVDNVDFAQFVFMILQTQLLHHLVSSIVARVVLVIGDFIPSRTSVLNALREELRTQNYAPVVVQFPDSRKGEEPDKIAILSRLAKFIITDVPNSHDSTHQLKDLMAKVNIPIQLIHQGTKQQYEALRQQIESPLLLRGSSYMDADELSALLRDRVIAEAESRAQELLNYRS